MSAHPPSGRSAAPGFASLVLRRPERRTEEQRAYLTQRRTADPTIAVAVDLVDDFLLMLRRWEGNRLPAWLDTAEATCR